MPEHILSLARRLVADGRAERVANDFIRILAGGYPATWEESGLADEMCQLVQAIQLIQEKGGKDG